METTTLSYDNMHEHGALFPNMLRARHQTFIEAKNWDLPEELGMEFDQYDTAQSRWCCVHVNGRVMAGVRLTPTTADCGIYSYMVRDAQRGLLDTIPGNLLWDTAPDRAAYLGRQSPVRRVGRRSAHPPPRADVDHGRDDPLRPAGSARRS
jgi:acyl homoserine lactone synthase